MDPDENGIQSSSSPLPTPTQHIVIESQLSNEPVFDVASPTPTMSTNKYQSEEQHPLTRPSTPISSPNAMVLSSPVNSFSQIPSSSTKRRVFFGPRMGCEKCKVGIKGHFIHSE